MKMIHMEPEYASDEHVSASEEDEEDDRKHAHLLDAILSLDGKKKQKLSQRTVPATEVSEFNFKKSGNDGKVKLHELVGTLRKTVQHGTLKKQLKTLKQKNRVADAPLSRPEKERIQRTVTYDKTKEEVTKWEPVIKENRKAEQLQFPLQRPELSFTADEFVKRFKPRTPLEVEIAAVLQGSESRQTTDTVLTPAEERAMQAMDVQEAIERRAELQKYRALLSYQEAKAKRQKKIKSKRYHKILRKEKLKAEKKSIAELQMTDPEAYLEKLKQLDKDRMQERMSLKHKSGGKFARRKKIFGKYDDETRQAIQDMHQKNKELTEKLHVEGGSDDEQNSEDDGGLNLHDTSSGSNPWMSAPSVLKSTSFRRPEKLENIEVLQESDDSGNDDVISDSINKNNSLLGNDKNGASINSVEDIGSQTLTEKNRSKKLKKKRTKKKKQESSQNEPVIKIKKDSHKTVSSLLEDEPGSESLISERLNRKRTLEEIDELASSCEEKDYDDDDEAVDRQTISNADNQETDYSSKMITPSLDPKKIFTVETELLNSLEPDLEENEDGDDSSTARRITIAQAFADDDVLEEFSKEKQEIADREKPKDINLTLPGWGEWGGTGLIPSKHKRQRFLLKAPPGPPRQDHNLGHVIISEQKDKSISKYQVNQLPFPFTSAEQFEKSIRAPIGKTWNPETAFKQLTKPKVITKLGAIIAPINKEAAFKNLHKNQKEEESDGRQKEKQYTKVKKRKQKRNNKNKK